MGLKLLKVELLKNVRFRLIKRPIRPFDLGDLSNSRSISLIEIFNVK